MITWRFTKTALVTACVALYALHQDFWFWRTARPLVFGFLPIGLFYHAATRWRPRLLWLLVRRHWPSHLEERPRTHTDEPRH